MHASCPFWYLQLDGGARRPTALQSGAGMVRNKQTVLPTGHPREYTSNGTTQVSQADRIAQNVALVAAGQRKGQSGEGGREKSVAEARAEADAARAEADAARARLRAQTRASRPPSRPRDLEGRPAVVGHQRSTAAGWMSVPLRGRLWYLDYLHCTGAARLGGTRTDTGRCSGGVCGVCGVGRCTWRPRRCVLSVYCMRVCTRSAPAVRASHAFRLNIFSIPTLVR